MDGTRIVVHRQPATVHETTTGHLPRFLRSVTEVLIAAIIALTLAGAVRQAVVQPYFIPTPSMAPTIHPGDRVLVNKLQYRFTGVHRGDVVVFPDPTHTTPLLIKRVVAVGGDIIDVRNGHLVVNGEVAAEPYTGGRPTEPGPSEFPMRVPSGHVFLMGDNRTDSHDSRWFGAQPIKALRGKAFALYWPLDHFSDL